MPRGDGTGPRGEGPATGRGLGGCVPKSNQNGVKNGIPNGGGRGLGRGRGIGRGRGLGRGLGRGRSN